MKKILLIPISWFGFFFVGPICIMLIYSFLSRGSYGEIVWDFQFQNYVRAIDPLYFKVYFNSLKLAMQTTLMCLFLGVPIAYLLAISKSRYKNVFLFLIVLPFLTNFLIRTYALKNLLLGFLIDSQFIAVQLGMITNYLPLMILPLYIGFEKFDFSLIEAARDLGANSYIAFFKIFIPNNYSSLVSAALMVFIPCLGEFVIPDLLGGAQVQTLGKLISEQILKVRDWPFAASLAMIMILIMLVPNLFSGLKRFLKLGKV